MLEYNFCLPFTIKNQPKTAGKYTIVPWILWVWLISIRPISGVVGRAFDSWLLAPPEALGSTHDFHHHSSRGLGPRGGDDAEKALRIQVFAVTKTLVFVGFLQMTMSIQLYRCCYFNKPINI